MWRPLPPAPLTPGPASISGDRNITLVVTPGATFADPPRWAVLDDDAGRLGWDEPSDPDIRVHGAMPAPSLPPGIGYAFASAREAALLISHQADGSAVASWFTGMWPGEWSDPVRIPLPADGSCPAIDLPSFGWIGVGADGQPAALITDAWGGDEWQALPTPPRAAATGGMLVWGPGHLIAADGLVAWDIARQRWVRLPPLPGGPRTGVSAAWFDGRLYVWGGATADGRLSRSGWMFTPDLPADTFRLPGGHRDGYGDCGGVGNPVNAVMHADRTDPRLVWFTLGRSVYSTTWPDGYVVDFSRGRAHVLGPDGKVVAREGDRLRDLDIGWCPGFDIIGF